MDIEGRSYRGSIRWRSPSDDYLSPIPRDQFHLLPFHGIAHVAYLPERLLASLSSLARVIDCFAHRLEIQETVTRQIAEALDEHLDARGAFVILETDQTCLTARGIEKESARTVTRHCTGAFLEESALRSEMLASLANSGGSP